MKFMLIIMASLLFGACAHKNHCADKEKCNHEQSAEKKDCPDCDGGKKVTEATAAPVTTTTQATTDATTKTETVLEKVKETATKAKSKAKSAMTKAAKAVSTKK